MAPKAIVTDGAPNTVQVKSDQLGPEIAATALALLDKREARTMVLRGFNNDIKKMEKRLRDLANQVKQAGMRDSFQMNFGSVAVETPADEDDNDN